MHCKETRVKTSLKGRFPFNGLTGQTRNFVSIAMTNVKIWSMFHKYLAKMDLILILSKCSGQIGPKPGQTFCVSFNNLTGLAVLMDSALNFKS
jgi:hypothetical protein